MSNHWCAFVLLKSSFLREMLSNQRIEELLILTKTYPTPSTGYRETTCVAAINRQGQLRRLFPIPFRFLSGEQKFKKWEWIRAVINKAPKDHRQESYRIDVDTIEKLNEEVPTNNGWAKRRQLLTPHLFEDFTELENDRQSSGKTFGIIKVNTLLGLEITPLKESDWTDKERINLTQEVLFETEEARRRPPLRKIPFNFHYRYVCESNGLVNEYRHMLTDWEVGALYWNCIRSDGPKWEIPFRQKLEDKMQSKDLMLLMGTIHRFPDQWLIIGLIYPPKPQPTQQTAMNFD